MQWQSRAQKEKSGRDGEKSWHKFACKGAANTGREGSALRPPGVEGGRLTRKEGRPEESDKRDDEYVMRGRLSEVRRQVE